jgi:hypothetical protein
MNKTIAFLALFLILNTSSAIAQEEWFEIAEASAIIYSTPVSREVPVDQAMPDSFTRKNLSLSAMAINLREGFREGSCSSTTYSENERETAMGNVIDDGPHRSPSLLPRR